MLVMNYRVYSGEIQGIDLTKHRMIVNTISPHSYTAAKKDYVFREALLQSDILLPDGYGIVWAVNKLFNKKINRIAGADMHDYLLRQLQEKGGKVFYMGSKQNTLNKIEHRLKKEYPSVKMESFSPPYKPEFSQAENEEIINKINQFAPDVLFVGMTAPKQEKWLHENKHLLNVMTMCCIGAVFDFYSGTVTRSGPFWINHGLEWLPRFVREPRRLWRRIFISIPVFMIDVFLYKFGIKRSYENIAIKHSTITPVSPQLVPQPGKESKKKAAIIVPLGGRKWYMAVASVAFLMILCGLPFTTPSNYSNDDLFRKYYSTENILNVARSRNANIVEAVIKFQQKDYKTASQLFSIILQSETGNAATWFYNGIACIETEQFDNAIKSFQRIITDDNSLYIELAEWYLGLCYLKNNEMNKAIAQFRKIASDSKNYYKVDAQQLLAKLQKK